MKQMTIQNMIDRLEELKKELGPDQEVFYFVPGAGYPREHAPFEVEEIEYRLWQDCLMKLIIK